jgi:hypothetical protein
MEDGTDLASLLSLYFALAMTGILGYAVYVICGPTGKDAKKVEALVNSYIGSEKVRHNTGANVAAKDATADEWLS